MKAKREVIKYPPLDFTKLEKYKNQFVAFGDDGETVIAHGKDSTKVLERAWALGVKEPNVMWVPKDISYKILIV